MSPVPELPVRRNRHLPQPTSTRSSTQPRRSRVGMAGAGDGAKPGSFWEGKGRVWPCSTTLVSLSRYWLRWDSGEQHWVAGGQHCVTPKVTPNHPTVGRAGTGKYTRGLQHPAGCDPSNLPGQQSLCVRCQPGAGHHQQANTGQKAPGLGRSGRRAVGAARLRGQGQADKGAGAVSKGSRRLRSRLRD